MKLSEMRELLDAAGVRLTKALGQNFLHDANQVRRIAQVAELTHQDCVLEIGPGLGPLTEQLLAGGGEVLAIEKDRRLVEILSRRLPNNPKLRLVHEDALAYLERHPTDWSEWKMVSNLPYSVASPLLIQLVRTVRCPKLMVATLQLEVARRIIATPGSSDYGVLSLRLQIRYRPRLAFKIPASCFFPAPEVDSACVTLVRRERCPLAEEEMPSFVRIVHRGFSQRRKMMLKLLRSDWPAERLEEAFARLGLERTIRAEELGVDDLARLTRKLHPAPADTPHRPPRQGPP